MRARRRSLNPSAQTTAAEALARQLLRLPEVQRARHIACYLPQDGEISPQRFAARARHRGKHILLPALRHFPHDHVAFAEWRGQGRQRRNRFGINEPVNTRHWRACDLDLILLPLVGFDSAGGRLGMGGGFYDRTLAFKHGQRARKPVLIGIAHECQRVETLIRASWDVPLRAIVTDRHCYRAGKP